MAERRLLAGARRFGGEEPRRPVAAQIRHDHPAARRDQRRRPPRRSSAAHRESRAAGPPAGRPAAHARHRRWQGSEFGRCGALAWAEHAGGRGGQGRGVGRDGRGWHGAGMLRRSLLAFAGLLAARPGFAQTGPQPTLPQEPLVIVTRDGTRHQFRGRDGAVAGPADGRADVPPLGRPGWRHAVRLG